MHLIKLYDIPLRRPEGRPPGEASHSSRFSRMPPYSPTVTVPVLPSAVITAPPSSSSIIVQFQIVQLSTTLTISGFNHYYHDIVNPSQSFTPTYYPLPDGSLITPPYLSHLKYAHTNIIFLSVLTALFFRNILISGDYIRRGKIKKKGLFYLLFASQLLGPVVLLPQLLAYFHSAVNCSV